MPHRRRCHPAWRFAPGTRSFRRAAPAANNARRRHWRRRSLVSGEGVPPKAGTCKMAVASAANKIRPSLVHVPPRPGPGVSQMAVAVSAVRSMRRSLPSAKNAMDLLSGDQNGEYAPSVPNSGRTTRAVQRAHPQGASPAQGGDKSRGLSVRRQCDPSRTRADGESSVAGRHDVESQRVASWTTGRRNCETAQPPSAPITTAAAIATSTIRQRGRDDITAGCSNAHASARFSSSAV